MILADKIINERKKNGWSQEEFAEKLGVSRQSVSKWEGAQAVPELQKILNMAELFGVSTDYLLKDEIEESDIVSDNSNKMTDDEPPKIKVSMEEANAFLKYRAWALPKTALGVALCITCAVILILLAVLSSMPGFVLSEGAAVAIGMVFLLGQIAAGVALFLKVSSQGEKYDYISKKEIDTEYGVEGLARELKEKYNLVYHRGLIIGISLCIICPIPLIVTAVLDAPEYVVIPMVALLLLLVAVGVYILITACGTMDSYNMLLQERDYSHQGKINAKKVAPFVSIYWSLIVGVFLVYSFITKKWDISWIFFACGGVLFPLYKKIVKICLKIEEEDY